MSNMKFLCIAAVLCVQGLQAQTVPLKNLKWSMPKVQIKSNIIKPPGPTIANIIDGTLATLGQYPYQANLIIDNLVICGGSLIGPRWILTAAHCLKSNSSVIVRLGTLDWTLASEESRITQTSTFLFIHPQYNGTTLRNDLALIKLPIFVNNTDYVSSITLASDTTKTYVGFDATVSGWGKTSDTSTVSNVLLGVTLSIITNSVCQQTFGTTFVTYSTICAAGFNTESICSGDSGGPLTVMDAGVRKQVGIVSFASLMSCVSGAPQGFTRVTSFARWIRQIMSAN